MKLQEKQTSVKGKCRIIKTNSKTGDVILTTPFYDNLVMRGTDTGIDLILDRLNGTNTYTLNINYCDIGTDNTAPTIADTTLGSASARTAKATGSISGNELVLRFFFADGDLPDDDYYETGLFIDGTASVDTGQIFDRLLFGSVYTKATGEDTTLEFIIEIN